MEGRFTRNHYCKESTDKMVQLFAFVFIPHVTMTTCTWLVDRTLEDKMTNLIVKGLECSSSVCYHHRNVNQNDIRLTQWNTEQVKSKVICEVLALYGKTTLPYTMHIWSKTFVLSAPNHILGEDRQMQLSTLQHLAVCELHYPEISYTYIC